MTILKKVVNEMGGGLSDLVSMWGVERCISVSMQAIKVGESPERSQVSVKGTPGVWVRLVDDAMARGEVPSQWIVMGLTKLSGQVNLGIIWHEHKFSTDEGLSNAYSGSTMYGQDEIFFFTEIFGDSKGNKEKIKFFPGRSLVHTQGT